MLITKSNTEWHRISDSLMQAMQCTGVLGYGVAKNYRLISDAIKEYVVIYNQGIQKYGAPITLDDGSSGYSIVPGTEAFEAFKAELAPIAKISNAVDIFMVPIKDAMDQLTAAQMVQLDFMLQDNLTEE